MNTYQIYARLFPGIISVIPALVFQYFFVNPEIADFLSYLGNIKFIGEVTVSIVLLYLFIQLNRLISKTYFEREEIFMPTTEMLLFSNNEYSGEYKHKIYEKIQNDFSLHLPSANEQRIDEINSRRRIAEAISLIRGKVGTGRLLLQHNREYGFWRNLIGGAPISSLIAGIDMIFSIMRSDYTLLAFCSLFLLGNLILLIFNKQILGKVGKLYAKVLIQEYKSN